MSQSLADFIVVGSGCTGAMAAQTLVEANHQVLMLDVGVTNNKLDIPNKDFINLRRSDPQQHRYFIGDNVESARLDGIGKGAQITIPRQYMIKRTDELLPLKSSNFLPVESLGYGGLGIGWGLGCWQWSKAELDAAGLDAEQIREAYNTVARRIGISATSDDAREYTLGSLDYFQPSLNLDGNGQLLYRKYLKHKTSLYRRGFVMGRAPLALLTKDFNNRKAYAYRDLDYYDDKDQSAWRPWIMINTLKKRENFRYVSDQLVLSFKEQKNYVSIKCLDINTRLTNEFRAKKLILAPGVLGSARIVLRSLDRSNTKTPLLCNPYTLIPCLQPSLFGKGAEPRKTGFAQLSLFLDEDHQNFDSAMASIYSYQSLMLFRIIKNVPLNFVDARLITRYLMSGMIIMGVHQPDKVTKNKFVRLISDKKSPTGDALQANYALNDSEQARRNTREKAYIKAMRLMGAHAIKRIDPGHGASIHYAGTLPTSEKQKPFSISPTGRLHGTRQIYIADGSGFNYLPAKGLTFTLMANAHRVAREAMNG